VISFQIKERHVSYNYARFKFASLKTFLERESSQKLSCSGKAKTIFFISAIFCVFLRLARDTCLKFVEVVPVQLSTVLVI
jgi:hypothetical protein